MYWTSRLCLFVEIETIKKMNLSPINETVFGVCELCEDEEELYQCCQCANYRCYSCLDSEQSTCDECTPLEDSQCFYCGEYYKSLNQRRFFTLKKTACRGCIVEWDPYVCMACGCNIRKTDYTTSCICIVCGELRCVDCVFHSRFFFNSDDVICLICYESTKKHFALKKSKSS